MENIKIYKEDGAILPIYGSDDAVGLDMYVNSIEENVDGSIVVRTGIHVELPKNIVAYAVPRSSLTKTHWYVANSPGIIDPDYRGEITLVFRHSTPKYIQNTLKNLMVMSGEFTEDEMLTFDEQATFPYKVGDRCGQLVIAKFEKVRWNEVNALSDLSTTDRGNGGYGSTGK